MKISDFNKLQVILKPLNPFSKKALIASLTVFSVTVVVLGILTSHEIDYYGVDNNERIETDLKILNESLKQFYMENGSYPESLDILVEMNYLAVLPVRESISFNYQLENNGVDYTLSIVR
ncbi:hypothetical protein FKG94_00005 [Exilibacterium tricleocarpae]|uniref:Type II secretion system protein GspG C-terminal domain-containing protein n=1 Tax=Exilibacterium tricleocarpae TaxID=2591008 RepID=A0A545UBC2_9GAMM|nr:hypothetical protein [Exilibacterium tricleocarpae]TQV86766.1 hypothetical protein FKG94_00005 [Exilibacterium tricleocarpae]